MNTTAMMKSFINTDTMIMVRDAAIQAQKESLKVTGSDYVVRYGHSFSHITEYRIFKLYRDAVKFFESLDRDLYQSAFLYKQNYYVPEGEIYSFACEKVEYKKHYTEIKRNNHILEMMADGIKF